jgi:hypothetical protein
MVQYVELTGRKEMKGQVKKGLRLGAVLLVAATLSLAQTSMSPTGANYAPESNGVGTARQVVSAPRQAVPGTINYVEGQATLNGQQLTPGETRTTVVQPNGTIDTQAGYVEVLLTPGAFLRIGHDSEVAMPALGLANIQIQVVRGSAMIEAADLVKDTVMQVSMGGATTSIEKHGLYDFDANQQLVRVLDGKAKLLEASRVKTIGKGDQVVLRAANLKSQGFDKKAVEADPLYVWSRARSEAEAQSNIRVANNIVVNGGWYGSGWYWDPLWADYAFLPGAGLMYSPFGWGFYSPGFVYAAPVYGFYGRGFYGRGFYGHRVYAHPGVAAGVHSYVGGFHGGFAGGFHGGRR